MEFVTWSRHFAIKILFICLTLELWTIKCSLLFIRRNSASVYYSIVPRICLVGRRLIKWKTISKVIVLLIDRSNRATTLSVICVLQCVDYIYYYSKLISIKVRYHQMFVLVMSFVFDYVMTFHSNWPIPLIAFEYKYMYW